MVTDPPFLLYSPLNQGLKPKNLEKYQTGALQFLLYSPLNQGLKQITGAFIYKKQTVFTLQSIKSRIETRLGKIIGIKD